MRFGKKQKHISKYFNIFVSEITIIQMVICP